MHHNISMLIYMKRHHNTWSCIQCGFFFRYRYYLYLLKGDPMHGYWDDNTTKSRCILRCVGVYEPSGCHVIRYSHREGNHDVPSCQKSIRTWVMSKRKRSTLPPTHQNIQANYLSSIYPSIYLSIHLSIHPSICLFAFTIYSINIP